MPIIKPVNGKSPQIPEDCYVAENATIVGDVSIADFACYAWLESAWLGLQNINPKLSSQFKHLDNWMLRMKSVEGVAEGMEKLKWGAAK